MLKSTTRLLPVVFGSMLAIATSPTSADETVGTIHADVDATQLSRHLLRSTLTIPVAPGKQALWFPKWIPGIHGPGQQIGNVAGLTINAVDGSTIAWQRDPDELYRFLIDVPRDVDAIEVNLTYIANQPSTLSVGVDSFGNSDIAIINFNTCLVYPEAVAVDEMPVALRVKLPAGWEFGTALPTISTGDRDQWQAFETASLETVIDSPLIAGRHYRRLTIDQTGGFPTSMHFVSESGEALDLDQQQVDHYQNLVREAARLFGGTPFGEYHFLVVCSDELPFMGLEHHASSLNGIPEQALVDDDLRKGWSAYLLPHELVHAWCGKYRRPAGMYRHDYHTGKQTELLWIYEGLTQYLGHVLTARSELVPFETHLGWTASRVGYLSQRAGRSWRSLADTAVANYTLRGASQSWNDLRRGQDYYDEGALFWLEVDCLIRETTAGQKSLDDFCRSFFSTTAGKTKVKPYELEEVIAELEQLVNYDWRGLIRRRVYRPLNELPLEALWHAGYKFNFVSERPEYVKLREQERDLISAEYSIGVSLEENGQVLSVAPDSAADRAGLATTMEIVGVNGRKFTASRIRSAIAAATNNDSLDLLVLLGDRFREIHIQYDGGERYPGLERCDDQPDLLKAICAPRAAGR